MKKVKLFSLAIMLLSIIVMPSCKKTKTDPAPVITNTIAYIYKNNNTAALEYKALMEANNCAVTLIDKSAAATTDYSNYKLIVIDHNTDGVNAPQPWTAAEAAAIKAPAKPMLLIGAGGLRFATQNGNTVNWLQTAQYNEGSITVTDPASTIFSRPKTIAVDPNTKKVTLYTAANLMASMYVPTITLANVSIIGRNSLNHSYAPIQYESNRYGFFEFYSGVSQMTPAGQDFMVNYTYYIGGLTL
jgi:hypothetical protein